MVRRPPRRTFRARPDGGHFTGAVGARLKQPPSGRLRNAENGRFPASAPTNSIADFARLPFDLGGGQGMGNAD